MNTDREELATIVTALRKGEVRTCSEADRLLRRLDNLCGDSMASTIVMDPVAHFGHEPAMDELVDALDLVRVRAMTSAHA